MNLFSIPSLSSKDQGPPALLSVELPGIKVTGSDVSERGRTVWKNRSNRRAGSTLSNALPIDMKKNIYSKFSFQHKMMIFARLCIQYFFLCIHFCHFS